MGYHHFRKPSNPSSRFNSVLGLVGPTNLFRYFKNRFGWFYTKPFKYMVPPAKKDRNKLNLPQFLKYFDFVLNSIFLVNIVVPQVKRWAITSIATGLALLTLLMTWVIAHLLTGVKEQPEIDMTL